MQANGSDVIIISTILCISSHPTLVKPVNETSKTPKVLNSHFIIAEVHSLEASHCSQLVQQMLCCYKAVLQDVNITVQDQAVSM